MRILVRFGVAIVAAGVGIALSATLLQRFTAIHRADLAAHVTPFAEATRERMAMITQALVARGDAPVIAQTKAIGFLNGIPILWTVAAAINPPIEVAERAIACASCGGSSCNSRPAATAPAKIATKQP